MLVLMQALEWALGAWGSQSPQQIMQQSMELSSSHSQEVASLLPDVDISNELTQLLDVQAALGVSDSLLYQCVLDCAGDVRNAAQRMVDQLTVVSIMSSGHSCMCTLHDQSLLQSYAEVLLHGVHKGLFYGQPQQGIQHVGCTQYHDWSSSLHTHSV